jgi:hypothetical protein
MSYILNSRPMKMYYTEQGLEIIDQLKRKKKFTYRCRGRRV